MILLKKSVLSLKSFDVGKINAVELCQVLIICDLIFATRAFALVNLIEFVLVGLFLFNKSLRRLFKNACHDWRVISILLFWAFTGVSSIWSDAALLLRLEEFWSWRKLMLVPMVFAVFSEIRAKKLMLWAIVLVCFPYMVLSWLGFLEFVALDRSPHHFLENHATQGVLFSLASFIIVLILSTSKELNFWTKFFLLVLLVGYVSNILMVVTGRSGYLFLIAAIGYGGFSLTGRNKVLALIASTVIGLVAVSVFDKPRQRIIQAVTELQTAYDEESNYTSLGIRLVMWDNTLTIIGDSPVLGTGAGGFKGAYEQIVRGQGYVENRPEELWRGKVSDDPHQQYLHIWAEHGIFGLAIFLWALFLLIRSGWAAQDSIYKHVCLLMLLGTILNGFANGHFSSFVEGRYFWILVPAMLSQLQLKAQ